MKYLTLIWLALASIGLQAQNGYIFTEKSAPYEMLSQGDTVSPTNWDDPEIPITLSENVVLFGQTLRFPFVYDGALAFVTQNEDSLSAIIGYATDLMSRQIDTTLHLSPIILHEYAQMEERAFTIEYRNCYFYLLDGFFDFVNFQIHYLRDGTIQFHYGESQTDLAKVAYNEEGEIFGGGVGIGVGTQDSLISGLFLEGPTDNLQVIENELGLVEGFPNVNTLYEFKPIDSNTSNHNAESRCFTYIHDRIHQVIQISEGSQQDFMLVDAAGHYLSLGSTGGTISLSGYPTGIYHLIGTECGQVERIFHQ